MISLISTIITRVCQNKLHDGLFNMKTSLLMVSCGWFALAPLVMGYPGDCWHEASTQCLLAFPIVVGSVFVLVLMVVCHQHWWGHNDDDDDLHRYPL